MNKSLILLPRLSEQTYALSQNRVYVFDVPPLANKHNIARAVAQQFEVSVETVNVMTMQGKIKRTVSLTGKRRGGKGSRRATKKAYVKLAEGFSLPVFAAIEEAEEKEQATQEKMDKVAKRAEKAEAKELAKLPRRHRGLLKKEEKV